MHEEEGIIDTLSCCHFAVVIIIKHKNLASEDAKNKHLFTNSTSYFTTFQFEENKVIAKMMPTKPA